MSNLVVTFCQASYFRLFLPFQDGPPWGRVKQGRFVILRLGSQHTQMLGNTAWRVSLSHPFCVPQMLVQTRIWEQCPHMLGGKARGKWQIDPILPIYWPTLLNLFDVIERQRSTIIKPEESLSGDPSKDHSTCDPSHHLHSTISRTAAFRTPGRDPIFRGFGALPLSGPKKTMILRPHWPATE